MTKEEKDILIDRFLDETLTPEETVLFRETYSSDDEFKLQVKQELDVQCALSAVYACHKEQRLSNLSTPMTFDAKQFFVVLSLAATLALILMMGYFIWDLQNQLSESELLLQQKETQQQSLAKEIDHLNEEKQNTQAIDSTSLNHHMLKLDQKEKEIFALQGELARKSAKVNLANSERAAYSFLANKFFEPTKVDIGSIRNGDTEYQDALKFYSEKNYAEANKIFERMLEGASGIRKNDILFFYGSSCLASTRDSQTGDSLALVQAANCFITLVGNYASPLYGEALWMLALTYIKMGNKKESIDLLNKIVETKGFNHSKAKALLVVLE